MFGIRQFLLRFIVRFFPSDGCERVVSIAHASSRIKNARKHLHCRKNILGQSKPPRRSGPRCHHKKRVSTYLCRSVFDKKLEELDFCKLLAREDNRCTN